MEREPGIGRDESAAAGVEDEAIDTWIENMPPWPDHPITDEEGDAADAGAETDNAAGRVYPHPVVRAWLKTWGDPDYRPVFEWLKSSG